MYDYDRATFTEERLPKHENAESENEHSQDEKAVLEDEMAGEDHADAGDDARKSKVHTAGEVIELISGSDQNSEPEAGAKQASLTLPQQSATTEKPGSKSQADQIPKRLDVAKQEHTSLITEPRDEQPLPTDQNLTLSNSDTSKKDQNTELEASASGTPQDSPKAASTQASDVSDEAKSTSESKKRANPRLSYKSRPQDTRQTYGPPCYPISAPCTPKSSSSVANQARHRTPGAKISTKP